jgi:hypothetical protein
MVDGGCVPCHATPSGGGGEGAMGYVVFGNDHLHWLLLLDRDRLGARHEPSVLPFWGVLISLYLTKLRLRHLHGTCASRIRRVKRPPCACLELRWTGGISDGKKEDDQDREEEGHDDDDDDDAQTGDDGLWLGMGWTQDGMTARVDAECSI